MAPPRSKFGGARRRSAPPAERPRPTQRREPTPLDPERSLARQPWSSLRPLIAGAPDPEGTLAGLRAYALALLEWNRGVSNLISRHDEMRLVERHLAESLQPAELIRACGCRRLLDLGSGAGLPAIPLALAGVGEHWRLVESRRNKTLFMRKTIGDSKLKHIEVDCSRLETLLEDPELVADFDGFTSRATMAAGPTLAMAAGVVAPGGRAFLWKGSGFVEEKDATAADWGEAWEFEASHPILAGPNCLAVFIRK